MKIAPICMICVAVLATGKEHNHTHSEQENQVYQHDKHNEQDHREHSHDHGEHDHKEHDHDEDDNHGPGHEHTSHRLADTEPNPVHDYQTWLAASGSILLISLCGIFGVMVIPIMQRVFYQHLIQFLIALAVGTLAGDALLHLLPHAFLAGITAGNKE